MPFMPLWKKAGTKLTPTQAAVSVEVTSSGGKISFFGVTPVTRPSIPADLLPSASLADVIAYTTALAGALEDTGLVEKS